MTLNVQTQTEKTEIVLISSEDDRSNHQKIRVQRAGPQRWRMSIQDHGAMVPRIHWLSPDRASSKVLIGNSCHSAAIWQCPQGESRNFTFSGYQDIKTAYIGNLLKSLTLPQNKVEKPFSLLHAYSKSAQCIGFCRGGAGHG